MECVEVMAVTYEHWSPEHEQFGWVDGNGRWRPTSEAAPWWRPDADEQDAYWWQQRVDDATYAAQQRRKRDPFYKEH